MGRRKRSGGGNEEVETNLTSALDLIFNILAFFVVTFNPPKPEQNFDVTLPPPKEQQDESEGEMELPDMEAVLFEDIQITLTAGPTGALTGVNIAGKQLPGTNMAALTRELRLLAGSIGGATGEKLEAATIAAPPTLKYRYVINVIDACYSADIKKINFSEGSADAGGGGAVPF